MRTIHLGLVRGIVGALVLGALGFGSSQALASGASSRGTYTCTPNDAMLCDDLCGGPGRGYCYYLDPYFENRECQCLY